VRRISKTGIAAALLVAPFAGVLATASPADAWCYVSPISATLDWEWNGSDANINWGGGDIAFSPTNAGASAVLNGPKSPKLNAQNDTVAGWTARSRGNVANIAATGLPHVRYGGWMQVVDSFALRLAKDLRPCT